MLTKKPGKTWLLGGAAAVILLLGAVLYSVRAGGRRARPAGAPADRPAAPSQAQVALPGQRPAAATDTAARARTGPAEGTPLQQRAQAAFDEYRKFAVYPPWSRPADASQIPTVQWNAPVPGTATPLVAAGKDAKRDPAEPPLFADLSLDRMFAGPGQPILATVRAWTGEGDARTPAPDVKIDAGVEMWKEKGGWTSLAKVRFVVVPGEPGSWQARVVPSSVPALSKDVADVRLAARVRAGERTAELAVPFRQAPSAAVVVYGAPESRIRDGSLEVDLDLDVRMAGPLRVEAVLAAEDGARNLAVYADYQHPKPGRQRVTITFFGRILAEAKIDGPYQVTTIHGLVKTAEGEVFWAAERSYPTSAYRASDFSAAEWSSPDKDAKISAYERLIQVH